MRWSELDESEKLNVYKDRYVDNKPIAELASRLGMNPVTLNRRLQEMREALDDGFAPTVDINIGKKSETTEDENHKTLSVTMDRITTLDELLKVCNVDLDVWAVDRYVVNTYEGYRKSETKELSFEAGTITGHVSDTGGFRTTTLYQVKAWLIRKDPIPVSPVITPVLFPQISFPPVTTLNIPIKKTLIIPDCHIGFRLGDYAKLIPFHDRLAMSVVLQVLQKEYFDNVVVLGDLLDFADFSDKFLRSPDFFHVTQPAIEEAAWFLRQIRMSQPYAQIHYIEGNHEQRLPRMITQYIPQLYKIQAPNAPFAAWSLENLLSLNESGINWYGDYPNGIVYLEDDLCVVHGSDLSAEKAVNRSSISMIFGHIHRAEMATRVIYDGAGSYSVYAITSGFLGKLDGSVPGRMDNQKWSQGFLVVQHHEDLDPLFTQVTILDGAAMYGDKIYIGSDYKSQLVGEVPGKWNY